MLKTLKNAFKIKEIRSKIFFTLAMLVVIRIGSQLPTPGIDASYIQNWFANATAVGGDTFNFLEAFTGGSFSKMAIFALSINPYITSSIIMQLLTIAIPKLEEMQRDGEDGRKKIASITRYVTIVLSVIESGAMAIGFGGQGLLNPYNALTVIGMILIWTAGSATLMWIGERITDKGIGNGISIVLVINILSRLPQDITSLYTQFVKSAASAGNIARAVISAIVIIAIMVVMVAIVIVLNNGVRKIPVQYAKKVQGRKLVGGQSSSIPLKVNTAGVIPIIFASSLMQFPIIISSFFYKGNGVWRKILNVLNSGNWCNPDQPVYTIGLVIYVILVIFFAYFYTSITFNPLEVAENMKKQGGFIPGIRPGKPTAEYLSKMLNYIIFIGVIGLIIIAVLPFFFNGVFHAQVSFGGTSLIIIVSVILETIKQVESQMLVRNYKGFLND